MSTSDIKNKPEIIKAFVKYMIAAAFCIVFAIVYESFSHGVYSMSMILSFLYPLIGGLVLIVLAGAHAENTKLLLKARNFYMAGILTLTIGSIFSGILEIYGTTNKLVWIYTALGIIMAALGVLVFSINRIRTERRANKL